MDTCTHHWKQEDGNLHAPFVCKRCGAVKQMETDFYRLYEARYGKPWSKAEPGLPSQTISVAA